MSTLIKNAKIVTMAGDSYENGCILFDDKILYVGDFKEFEADKVIDVNGNYVLPGLIDAHCHVGMFEDSMGFEGDDGNEDSDPVMPHLRAIDGINPFDRGFLEARNAGITTVVTGPGSANPVGGQFAAVKTFGICVDDMIVKAPVAMKMALGENPKSVYNEKEEMPLTRMGTAALIRELLIKSRDYMERMDAYNENDEDNEKPEFDIKLDAMLPVLRREIPVKIHAHRADDICTAIRIGREFNIDVTIEHCSDGDAVAPVLEREGLPVMLGPTLSDRSKIELKNLTFGTYKNLSDRGISVAIITDHPEITIENLPLCAVMAVKHGMDEMKAIQGITITAAENCRIADRVGSLEVGKDADIAVFTELPARFDAECVMTFINGEKVK
ncbi:MAG: amidohydrolase [Clostridia bacterium]|jgi:imidazolonepropionase-like amidohydrolase|nr:amidohydrolase [Clostridia bacterium]